MNNKKVFLAILIISLVANGLLVYIWVRKSSYIEQQTQVYTQKMQAASGKTEMLGEWQEFTPKINRPMTDYLYGLAGYALSG